MHKRVFLTSTDTTVGFISKSQNALDKAKQRAKGKKYITALPNLKSLKKRVPKKHKNRVRRSKKTTYIVKGYSFRIVKNKTHNLLLNRLGWAYTTSANKSNEEFNINYATTQADIIAYPLQDSKPSKILKLGKGKIIKIRSSNQARWWRRI